MAPDAPVLILEPMQSGDRLILSGTAVAIAEQGLLIAGASGTGKSNLALDLLSRGAALIADDMVVLRIEGDNLMLDPPEETHGQIEARNVGILRSPARSARLALVADLDNVEDQRLPPHRTARIAGHEVPLVQKVESPHFASALVQYLRHGRIA